jgi:hypothetical protein
MVDGVSRNGGETVVAEFRPARYGNHRGLVRAAVIAATAVSVPVIGLAPGKEAA